jgi:hypothetical protein
MVLLHTANRLANPSPKSKYSRKKKQKAENKTVKRLTKGQNKVLAFPMSQ